MTTTINVEELKKDAVEVFHNGFTCSESVIYAIRKHFELDLPDDVIAMSSGFHGDLVAADVSVALLPELRCVLDISLVVAHKENR